MANSFIQLRIDEQLKEEATDIFERLGLDLPTAIRIFLTRSVQEKGIPFNMTLKKDDYRAEAAVIAMRELGRQAQESGTADMTPDDINAEMGS